MSNKYWTDKTDNVDNVLAGDFNSAFGLIAEDLDNKVDKEAGKGLSTNDYTDEEKEKLSGINVVQKEGDTGLVKLGNKTKGIDLYADGSLCLTPATENQIKTSKGKYIPLTADNVHYAAANSAHQTMSDDYDVTSMPVAANMTGKQGTLPASYDAVKSYVNSKIGVSLATSYYELIEEITTTEEISEFVRSQEPDGTEYNFKEILVLITGITGAVNQFFGYDNTDVKTHFSHAYRSGTIQSGATLYGKFLPRKGIVSEIEVSIKKANGAMENTIISTVVTPHEIKSNNYKKIMFRGTIAAGSTIKSYAVRGV